MPNVIEVLNIPKGGLYDRFFSYRESLIRQFSMRDLSKREFINENYKFITSLQAKPFNNIDCLQKGFFNYHYYNIMAKYRYMEARDMKRRGEHHKYYQETVSDVNHFYNQKDYSTRRILELIDYHNVEAYYIKVRSKFLKGELIEVILEDFDGLVLHTKNEQIRKRLKAAGVFSDGKRRSVIDHYINQKY